MDLRLEEYYEDGDQATTNDAWLFQVNEEDGEGFIGFAAKVSSLTGLERMIVEDCNPGSGGVQRPGLNVPTDPRHLRPEWISRRTGATLAEGAELAQAWRTLDATPAMIDRFIAGFTKKGKPAAALVEYFANLEEEILTADLSPRQRKWLAERGLPSGLNIDLKALVEPETVDPVFRYSSINNDVSGLSQMDRGNGIDDRHAWIAQQPAWFRRCLRYVKTCRSLAKLSELGQKIHAKGLTPTQGTAFWNAYKRRKQALESAALEAASPTAKTILARIEACRSAKKLAFIGFWLFDQESRGGKTAPLPAANRPTPDEFKVIWSAYRKRKAALTV